MNISREMLRSIEDDLMEENRRCAILYAFILTGGMGIMLILSLFFEVFVSSRVAYISAVAVGGITLLIAIGPAKHFKGFTVFCQYVIMLFLLGFGILLGTAVEPEQASASFAVLLFVTPLLFTDLPHRLNFVTIMSIVVYSIAAAKTQSPEIFEFNMSIVLPYGLTNLVLTYFTAKMKIERSVYAHEKKLMGEYDRLTGLLNRWSYEKDVEALKEEDEMQIGICSFDVNNLKSVNDSFGHEAGDEMLVAAARAIENTVGKYGKCYRVGGDEYMAIITGVFPSPEEFVRMLDREAALFRSDYGYSLSISGGVAEGSNQNIRELGIEADKIMYEHKRRYHITRGDTGNS